MPRTFKIWRRVGKASGPMRSICQARSQKNSHLIIKASSVHMRSINWAQRNINERLEDECRTSHMSRIYWEETQLTQDSFNANVENNEKSDDANHELNNKNEEENAWERSDENNVSNSLLMSMSQAEFMIEHVLCIC